jgi:hypothetical protein
MIGTTVKMEKSLEEFGVDLKSLKSDGYFFS